MRKLIAETNGLLAVFFSRERLPWGSDPDWRGDLKGNQHLLGGLADKDANEFLLAIPIADENVRHAIIAGARETSLPDAPVYPLMLDLQVEHWRSLVGSGARLSPDQFRVTAKGFAGRRLEIVRRVLRDYGTPLETTLERLSVARRFDRQAFEYVVRTFGTALPLDQFERIADLSFVTKGPDGFLTIHNAIAETIRESLSAEMRDSSVDALFRHFEERARVATPQNVSEESLAALFEAAFLRLEQGAEGYAAWLQEAADAAWNAARYASVASLWREANTAIAKQLGPDHRDTAASLNNLAVLLEAQGDFGAARPLHERALAIREKQLGPDHPGTAASLNNLAGLLRAQGDFGGARPLYERALAIWEKQLGPDHPNTATSLNNLAALLQAQGDFVGARPLYERALAIREKQLGPDHPATAASLNNLAGG
jgi:tetratricopeptide (TPR) repeat protein